ncbi:rRNA adenine dimethylase [Pseudodesulfovibrio sp. F-1]|uniref:rRNA adenine dimethylase n=1 Tax=Pseudodesulfovibrio alkaliphilus TaxID=2661613 RepID=A0A7K1KJZ6_9BACT|nr:class II aldolase/adducin family protein [Pseudodesulfovibrio alkaliphilus]MUM76379.1 rRNA adenine dimethylase [Pseudodesulfovibrio alkaliphilus]
MKTLCIKYARKLEDQGLCEPGKTLVGGLDAGLEWNRPDPQIAILAPLFDLLPINSLVFAPPAEPYATIIDHLAAPIPDAPVDNLRPEDTETRTFLHDIPVCHEFSVTALAAALARRKAAIVPGHGIVSCGTVSPEQGFVFVSSTVFACFVLFFSRYLAQARAGGPDVRFRAAFKAASSMLNAMRRDQPPLAQTIPTARDQALAAMAGAGRAVVGHGLVDSFFGNISCRLGDTILISQTGSSLDELPGCIDACPMDGSSTTGLTASSELTAHEDVYRQSQTRCILHGHPRFSVILSMDCDRPDCAHRGRCHVACPECRTVEGVPIVPGEVGTGPTGLCNTLPPALAGHGAAIVHGHGLFAASDTGFADAFATLLDTENRCREGYFRRLEDLLSGRAPA